MEVYSAWLLVVEPKHMPLEWSISCGRPVEEASINSTNESLDVREGKKIKNTIKEIT